ncbi:MAG: hypothetical protein UT86_C0001G0120 [Candidatus Magasanikbacteria bacterium GW2011_GWC2_40_17]|uniref:Uncharacterized protein n=1 Tax=Candidatus Magasanikbacteria bacterium GW2011_GWA2_42_32 TaxID=1619039 RepID=A0A0G1A8X9_9BACT|nr:MAG: hypothetical protein UT86_C0001G0120 [Candidatus Magasanikbacteria bacterium GW2011_GWC2_40_17]KKS57480.1 MAG: hypothetical protein UV20_C0001G0120 [Candidatus Magasanikbacteria bacterium GW2011_GWA2_42_32]OGH85196.1 MAG: hypothetical protein A2294_00405 [Candidatus Magasanikbacteria bacterium RIFOXYB2_FULL_38_10]
MLRIPLKLFFKDKIISFLTALNVISFLALFFYLFFSLLKAKEETIFLHYTVHLGVDLIGSKSGIYLLAWGAFLIVICNTTVAYLAYPNYKKISRLILIATVFMQIFLWLAGGFLVFINL